MTSVEADPRLGWAEADFPHVWEIWTGGSPPPRLYGQQIGLGGLDLLPPSPKAGRYLALTAPIASYERFQSSPSPKAGRYAGHNLVVVNAGEFQSSPSPKAGRYLRGRLRCC